MYRYLSQNVGKYVAFIAIMASFASLIFPLIGFGSEIESTSDKEFKLLISHVSCPEDFKNGDPNIEVHFIAHGLVGLGLEDYGYVYYTMNGVNHTAEFLKVTGSVVHYVDFLIGNSGTYNISYAKLIVPSLDEDIFLHNPDEFFEVDSNCQTQPSPTPTPSVTPTPTPTQTPSPSPTPSPSVTPTPSHTPTPSPTFSPTPTPSHTPTVTPTPTPTPTQSPTPTPTPIPTPTPVVTPTPTPTLTPTPSPTETPTPFESPTPSPSPSSGPTVTPSPSVTPTPTPTESPTPTPTPTSGCTVNCSGGGSNTPTPTPTPSPTPVSTPTGGGGSGGGGGGGSNRALPAIGIEKLGRDLTRGENIPDSLLETAPGNLVEFTIKITSRTELQLVQVKLRDFLPSTFTYVNSSTTVDGQTVNDDIISLSSLNLGYVNAGTSKVIKFLSRAGSSGLFPTGTSEYENIASVTSLGGGDAQAKLPILVGVGIVSGGSTIKKVADIKTGFNSIEWAILIAVVAVNGYLISLHLNILRPSNKTVSDINIGQVRKNLNFTPTPSKNLLKSNNGVILKLISAQRSLSSNINRY